MLSDKIYRGACSIRFQTPSLANFDGLNNPYENIASINTQVTIIRASDFLKCKLLSCTFMDAALRWYNGLPCAFINNYHELIKRLVHQFPTSNHKKMSTTSLFNIHQGPPEPPRDNFARLRKPPLELSHQTKK